ncbi:MAG: MerC family mercury resistance protein [Bacteroidetes bacterium]|jgi:multisubunit Na+/H+ antiporter MnhG subunit|nr:MerC family mercury resistance protein [Bacteroidota bacterium]
MNFKINWDAFGIATSVACAIHCAVLPLVLSSLPLFGINIIENQGFELLMIGLAFVVGVYSLYHGRKKHHHSYTPLLIFALGMVLMVVKSISQSHALWLLIPAVTAVITAHFLNYKLCRVHNHAHADDCNH